MNRWMMVAALAVSVPAHAGWSEQVMADVLACEQASAPCDVVSSLHLRETRAGHLMVQDDRLGDPATHGPLLHRLTTATDPLVRAALADAFQLAMMEGPSPYRAAWGELAASSPHPEVRLTLLAGLRRAPLEVAEPALRRALTHEDPSTRAAAAAAMGGHEEAARFVPALIGALQDPQAEVRAAACRGLAWAGDASAVEAVGALASDEDPLVRERVAYALKVLAP